MSTTYDPDDDGHLPSHYDDYEPLDDYLYNEWADPPDGYLESEAEREFDRHCNEAHGGGECDCPPPDWPELPPAVPHGTVLGGLTIPERIQLSRARGWRKPPGAVVVSRPSKWGNPFRVGERIDRNSPLWPYIALLVPGGAADLNDVVPLAADLVVTAYGWWFIEQPHLMLTVREELGGKDLACWCKLGHPCHGDWLLDFLTELEN